MSQTLDALIVELKADVSAFTTGLRGATKDIASFKNAGERQGTIKFSTDIRDLRNGIDSAQARIASLKSNTSRDRVLDVQADLRALSGQLQAAASDVARFGTAADRKAIVHLRAEMSSLKGQLGNATAEIDQFSRAAEATLVGRVKGAFLALGGATAVIGIGKEFYEAGTQMQQLSNRMIAVTGDAKSAGEAMAFIRGQANRLGQDLLTTGDGFAMFAASSLRAGLTMQQTQRVFTGVSEASAALHLSNERTTLVFQALAQMASKGKVSMEELRQQMGESLPGALQIFAAAMGVTTPKFLEMVQAGQVLVPDLVKLGDTMHEQFGQRAVIAADSAQGAFNRMNNATLELKASVANGGFMEALATAFKTATEAINSPALKDGLTVIGQIIGGLAIICARVVAGLAIMIEKVVELGKKAAEVNSGVNAASKARGVMTNPDRPSAGAMDSLGSQKVSMLPGNDMTAALDTGTMSDASLSGGATPGPMTDANLSIGGSQNSDGDPYAAFLQKRLALLDNYHQAAQASETQHRVTLADIQDKGSKQALSLQSQADDIMVQGRQQVMDSLIGFVQVFASKNKAIAIAMIAFEKAQAIARILISTEVAAMEALAIYGPTPVGLAAAASVRTMGYVSAGLVAATGLAQALTLTSGGGSSGGSSSSAGVSYGSGSSSYAQDVTTTPRTTNVYISIEGGDRAVFTTNELRGLVSQLNDVQKDGSRLQVSVL